MAAVMGRAVSGIHIESGQDALDAVAALFRAYAAFLSIDLARQGFAAELAGLPGDYAPPRGALLIARGDDGMALGCVALRPLADGSGEIKRMYVTDAARGRGVGRALLVAVLDAARAAGYRQVKLDTLAQLTAAQSLYRRFGFVPIAPYAPPVFEGQVFYAKTLDEE